MNRCDISKVKEITNRYNKFISTYKKQDIISISEFNIVSGEVESIYTNILFEIYNKFTEEDLIM